MYMNDVLEFLSKECCLLLLKRIMEEEVSTCQIKIWEGGGWLIAI